MMAQGRWRLRARVVSSMVWLVSSLVVASGIASTGCWRARHVAPASRSPDVAPIPGLRWMTPVYPWRANERVHSLVVLGDTALVGGARGWLSELDLRSGALVRERRLGAVTIADLLRLGDDEVLAVGMEDGHAVAYVVDVRTLSAEAIPLGGKRSWAFHGGSARLVPGEGVLIAGPGLPLAIYDPASWQPKRVLSEALGWYEVLVTDEAVFARHAAKQVKFSRATWQGVDSPRIHAAAGDVVIRDGATKGGPLVIERGGREVTSPRPLLEHLRLIDVAGQRIVGISGRKVVVRSLADATVLRTIELDRPPGSDARFALDGDRLLVTGWFSIYKIDLAAGTATSPGPAPVGALDPQLVVGDDGRVLVLDTTMTMLADGIVVYTGDADGLPLVNPPGELERFAVISSLAVEAGFERVSYVVRGRTLATWDVPETIFAGWLGRDGEVVFHRQPEEGQPVLLRSDGPRVVESIAFHPLGEIDDVDAEAGLAALTVAGTTHLVDVRAGKLTGETLQIPGCQEGRTRLERRGRRAAAMTKRELAAWERSSSTMLGSAVFDADIVDVTFVPGTDDLLVHLVDRLVVWSPATRELRVAALPHLAAVGVSPNGRHVALAFGNGQVASIDYAAMRAALPSGNARPVSDVPGACEPVDPLGSGDDDDLDHDDLDHDDLDSLGEEGVDDDTDLEDDVDAP